MNKDIVTTIIKNRDVDNLVNLITTEGKIEVLSAFGEVLDRRAYFTIDGEGEIKRRDINLAIPLFAFSDDSEFLGKNLIDLSDLKERNKITVINRMSSLEMEKVKENFIKTLVNGNLEFSKKYGKELFLRDREEFFKVVAKFSLMGNMRSLKPLMVLSFKKIMEKREYNENIFYLVIAFLTKYRDEFSNYENSLSTEEGNIENLKGELLKNSELLESREGLEVLSSLATIDLLDQNKRARFLTKLKNELLGIKTFTPLNEIERNLLSAFL